MDILQGSFSLIFVIISYILGLSILSKYFKFKTRDYIYVGLSWIGLSNPWMPDAVSFLMIIFLKSNLSLEVTFIIGYAILPFFLICWLIAFTDLIYKNKQKSILIIFIIFVLIFEYIFFSLLLTDPSLIGTFIGPFQIRWSFFMEIYLFFFILVAIITGILFASKSMKSHNQEVRIKGKFLLAAFISFAVAAVIEALFHLEPITVVITRTILISSAIEFYCGFILPKWMRKHFLVEE